MWDWSRPVVDHLDVHASDFARSVLFYETVLAPLGIPKLHEREDDACASASRGRKLIDREALKVLVHD